MQPARPAVRLLAALSVGLLATGLAACRTTSKSGARLERILESRTLRVGLSASQPPLNMRDKSGEIVGLEVELIHALAESMGLEAKLVPKPFAELLPALESGEVDLVISGVTITPDRNARVAFAGPYFVSGKSLLTRSKEIAAARDTDGLDDPEHAVAALAGSTSENYVRRYLPRAKLIATPDYEAGVQLVIDGEVDALIADFPFCEVATMRYPEAGLFSAVTPFTVEPLGVALPADDPLFVNLVQNYLVTLETTGLLTQLQAKWFSDGAWVAQLP